MELIYLFVCSIPLCECTTPCVLLTLGSAVCLFSVHCTLFHNERFVYNGVAWNDKFTIMILRFFLFLLLSHTTFVCWYSIFFFSLLHSFNLLCPRHLWIIVIFGDARLAAGFRFCRGKKNWRKMNQFCWWQDYYWKCFVRNSFSSHITTSPVPHSVKSLSTNL